MLFPSKNNVFNIVSQFGTPLYLYDSQIISNNLHALNNALNKKISIFYSIKANPNLSIVAHLCKQHIGAEVCSLMELEIALAAGMKPENIIFVGPAKKITDLNRCLELNIAAIVCESKEELRTISALAQSYNTLARVALRVNPTFSTKSAPLKMGGKSSQFGIDQTQLLQEENLFLSLPNINIVGIHVYNGSRILDPVTIAENTQHIFSLAELLQKRWRMQFSLVDIGGGIGIPYFSEEKEFCLEKFERLMEPIVSEFQRKQPKTKIILESGRFLVGTAGWLITEIQDIKKSYGEEFLITDAGMNCHMAAVGVGSFIRRNFPMSYIRKNMEDNEVQLKKWNIAGPLCTPGDLLGKQVLLPNLSRGDLIIVRSVGAYGPTASPTLFLSHGYPAEVLIKNGEAHLIRERDKTDDLLRKQRLI